jgi:hypothetical protein
MNILRMKRQERTRRLVKDAERVVNPGGKGPVPRNTGHSQKSGKLHPGIWKLQDGEPVI